LNNEKLTNPTQKLLNKYYEILSNYNKKAKKEENTSFSRDRKEFENSINSSHDSHSNMCSSTARSIDKFINTSNSENFRNDSKQIKIMSSKLIN
jgi:hypothetical protein